LKENGKSTRINVAESLEGFLAGTMQKNSGQRHVAKPYLAEN
jgi:hypothetical protein